MFATSGIAKAEIDFNDTSSYSFIITNDCTGEDLWVVLDLHILQTTVEKEDGTIQSKQMGNVRGWAVGVDTGDLYRYNNTFHFSTVDALGPEYFQSADIHTRFIGKGKTPNLRVVYSFRFEVDADGNISNVTMEDVICQGEDE